MKVNKLLVLMIIGFSIVFSPVTFSKQKKSKSTAVLDDLQYLGTDKDVVTAGKDIKPDGINDLHFQITHDFQKNNELVSVVISKIGGTWASNNPGNWVAVVKVDDKALNATANLPSLGNLSGKVKLDIYIASNTDPKLSEKNISYAATLTIKDKQGKVSVIQKTVTIK
jgi:hypothetical protein